LLLGVFAGLCELIPLLGPFLGAVPAVLLGFTVGPAYPLVVAAVFLVLQQLESNVLTPVVMKRQTGLRPFSVLLALIVGAALAGIWGALVAVPVWSALQIIVVRVVAPALRSRHVNEHSSPA
jgi:predicted PurR-regulated permease PerM